ncbi:MAG: TonB-dependent receptor [Pseudomonadota bacterium]
MDWLQKIKYLGYSAFAFSPMVIAMAADAQEDSLSQTSIGEKDSEVEHILVQGTKRVTTLQDSGVSVTVLSETDLKNARIDDIRQLDDLVPNVQFNESGQVGAVYVSIRGVESNPFIVNRAAVYIDGIPFRELNNSVMSNLSSVEVLRGPQSTLYGANSESGVIIINTRSPGDDFEGAIKTTFGDYDNGNSISFDSHLTGPLTDSLSGSLSVKYTDEDYNVKNIGATPQGPGQIDEKYIQTKLEWTPTDALRVNLLAYYIDTDVPGVYEFDGYPVDLERYNAVYSDGILFDPTNPFSPAPFNGELRADEFTFINDAPKRLQIEEKVIGLSAAYELTSGVLHAAASYRSEEADDRGFDIDNTNAAFLAGATTSEKDVWSAEVRYESDDQSSLFYTLGFSLYGEDEAESLGSLLGPGTLESFQYAPKQEVLSDDYGVFGTLNYRPAIEEEKLLFTFGLRYDRAKRQVNQDEGSLDLGFNVFVFEELSLEDEFTALLPRFGVKYEANDDVTIFGNISKGYIPGGFNITAAQDGFQDDVIKYEKEELWTYEIGANLRSADRSMRGSVALFYSKADNWQEIAALEDEQGNVLSTSFIRSVAAIESYGFEVEGQWQATDNLLFVGNLGVVNAEYTEFADEAAQVVGNPVKLVPDYDAGIAARYEWDSGWFARAAVNFIGDTALDEGNRQGFDVNAIDEQKAIEIVNLQLGYLAEDYSVRLYADNVFDERRISGAAFPNAFFPVDGILYAAVDAPRIIGLEFEYNFY